MSKIGTEKSLADGYRRGWATEFPLHIVQFRKTLGFCNEKGILPSYTLLIVEELSRVFL